MSKLGALFELLSVIDLLLTLLKRTYTGLLGDLMNLSTALFIGLEYAFVSSAATAQSLTLC